MLILLVIKWQMKMQRSTASQLMGLIWVERGLKEDMLLRCRHRSFLFQMILHAECTQDQLVSIATFSLEFENQIGVEEESQALSERLFQTFCVCDWGNVCVTSIQTCSDFSLSLRFQYNWRSPPLSFFFPWQSLVHYNLRGHTCNNQCTPNLSTRENFDRSQE